MSDVLPSPAQWEEWLKALHDSLWERKMDPRTRRPWFNPKRRVTADEWVQLQHTVREHGLVCSMRNANFGFGCGMTIYKPGSEPYPGAVIKPEVVCDITKEHLPLAEGQDRTTFDQGWAAFSPFTHSEANTALLAANGLPEPRAKSYYEY